MSALSLPDKVVAIDAALTAAGVPHAFGGALALAYYAEPRATIDVDVNVFAPPDRHVEVDAALQPLGVGGDVDPRIVERDGHCRLMWASTPVDLFYAYHELHDAMRRAVRRVPFGEDTLPVLAPEHLMVCKAIFNRPKDWLDIEQMLVAVGDLDQKEVQTWLEQVLGEDDRRVARLDRIAEGL